MNLTVDCALTAAQLHLPSTSALAQLLAKAQLTSIEKPLEAVVCDQYALVASPDYPMAAIAADVDGFEVGNDYWLRADPVHLMLQRDCFSLSEPVPVEVAHDDATSILAALNTHFQQDGLCFVMGKSGAWYLRLAQKPQIATRLPSEAMGKNIQAFMPQGLQSSKWLAVMNEVQMLLFDHPANVAREAKGEPAVNSVWFSGGGVMPPINAHYHRDSLMIADSAFYQGLAKLANVAYQVMPNRLDEILDGQARHVRLAYTKSHQVDEVLFSTLLAALKNKKVKKLTLHLGFYEKSIMLELKPLDMLKFWRSAKPVLDYFE